MSKCNHEQICGQCAKEEIAELNKQIEELNKRLPNKTIQNTIPETYYNRLRYSTVGVICEYCLQYYIGYHSCMGLIQN